MLKGRYMTPEHHYISEHGPNYSDTHWISEQLHILRNKTIREIVCKKYSEIYLLLLNEDPENARRRTNTWLRKTVAKNTYIKDGRLF